MPQNLFQEKESENLDYKLIYHKNKAKRLHDILCLSNADSKNPRQLIFGVSDDRREFPGILGDPNRITQSKLIDWLQKANLNYIPLIKLETISISEVEFDIITIENHPQKPYFLTQCYRDGDITLQQGCVYTRDKDVNTPINACASDRQIEKMYMERLGVLDEHKKLMKMAIEDADYNCIPGIGDARCPFRLDAHIKLLSSSLKLPTEVIDLLKKLLILAAYAMGGALEEK